MAAARAVLQTWELLKNILIHVPADRIKPLKRISKYWKRLISVRKARCAHPSRFFQQGPSGDIPSYAPGFTIKLHPALPYIYGSKDTLAGKDPVKRVSLSDYTVQILQQHGDSFVTYPRCSTMSMSVSGKRQQINCMIYVKDGIKIRDIVEVKEALIKTLDPIRFGRAWFTFEVDVTLRIADQEDQFERAGSASDGSACSKSDATIDSEESQASVNMHYDKIVDPYLG